MVRFTDKAREFWLQQSLDKGEMPKRSGVFSAGVLIACVPDTLVIGTSPRIVCNWNGTTWVVIDEIK